MPLTASLLCALPSPPPNSLMQPPCESNHILYFWNSPPLMTVTVYLCARYHPPSIITNDNKCTHTNNKPLQSNLYIYKETNISSTICDLFLVLLLCDTPKLTTTIHPQRTCVRGFQFDHQSVIVDRMEDRIQCGRYLCRRIRNQRPEPI